MRAAWLVAWLIAALRTTTPRARQAKAGMKDYGLRLFARVILEGNDYGLA